MRRPQARPLGLRLLDAVLAEDALARQDRGLDPGGRDGLRDGDKADASGRPLGIGLGPRDPQAHRVQALFDRHTTLFPRRSTAKLWRSPARTVYSLGPSGP